LESRSGIRAYQCQSSEDDSNRRHF
jgi:hypothetical protein